MRPALTENGPIPGEIVEVVHDDRDEQVEDEEAAEDEEGDEVEVGDICPTTQPIRIYK